MALMSYAEWKKWTSMLKDSQRSALLKTLDQAIKRYHKHGRKDFYRDQLVLAFKNWREHAKIQELALCNKVHAVDNVEAELAKISQAYKVKPRNLEINRPKGIGSDATIMSFLEFYSKTCKIKKIKVTN